MDYVECGNVTRRLTALTKEVESSMKDLENLGDLSSDAKALKISAQSA